MSDALSSGDVLVTDALGKVVGTDDIALALNTAFMGDGAVIRVTTESWYPLTSCWTMTGQLAASTVALSSRLSPEAIAWASSW